MITYGIYVHLGGCLVENSNDGVRTMPLCLFSSSKETSEMCLVTMSLFREE